MTQTFALLVDAYRDLNHRKLFWITLVLSGLVVAAFAFVDINERGLEIAIWDLPLADLNTNIISREVFFKSLFVNFGIAFWLAWIASILALTSTAGIFPSMLSEGAIDLVLSKPLSRSRLFLTKYIFGLLFVALQVSVFTFAAFLVIGIKGKAWEPAFFLAIPLVVIFYSYLFGVCVLLGIITRSTITALLLTLLFWFLIAIVHWTETGLLAFQVATQQSVQNIEHRIALEQAQLDRVTGSEKPTSERVISESENRIAKRRIELEDARESLEKIEFAHEIAIGVKTVLPKTAETIGILERALIDMGELPAPPDGGGQPPAADGTVRTDQEAVQREAMEQFRNRSIWWVIGTSLIFEGVVLFIAGFIFCRRDF